MRKHPRVRQEVKNMVLIEHQELAHNASRILLVNLFSSLAIAAALLSTSLGPVSLGAFRQRKVLNFQYLN